MEDRIFSSAPEMMKAPAAESVRMYQRSHALAREDAAVELDHVEREGQEQEVRDEREHERPSRAATGSREGPG